MRRWGPGAGLGRVWLFVAVVGLLATHGVMAGAGGGTFLVSVGGRSTEFGTYMVRYALRDATGDVSGAVALKVYSEPSHTLLSALMREDAPVAYLRMVQAEKPRSLLVRPLVGAEIHAGIAPPPAGDTRVRVVLVVMRGGAAEEVVVSVAEVGGFRDFEFTSELLPDGSFRHEGSCGGRALAPLACASPVWSLCCPGPEDCEQPRCGP